MSQGQGPRVTTEGRHDGTSCEACEVTPSSISEAGGMPADPLLLCVACHQRLTSLSLRPLEWFNLVRRHGWQRPGLNAYDEQGTALDPGPAVECPEMFPMPSVEVLAGNAESLLDHCMTRRDLSDDLDMPARWRRLPTHEVTTAFMRRLRQSQSASIRALVLSQTAALEGAGADIVREAWEHRLDPRTFDALVLATVACLPPDEAWTCAEGALEKTQAADLEPFLGPLEHFTPSRVLSWMERRLTGQATVGAAWGRLVAACGLDWHTAQHWLAVGGPLSGVALDALLAIARPPTPRLAAIRPVLVQPPDEARLRRALESIVADAGDPTVKNRVDALLSRASQLIGAVHASR